MKNAAPSPFRRAAPLLSALLLLGALGLFLASRRAPTTHPLPQSAATSPASGSRGSAPAPGTTATDPAAAPNDPTALAPRNAPIPESAKRAHDRAVVTALQRFQLESNVPLEQCLNAAPGPRVPYPLIVTFERQAPAAAAAAAAAAAGGALDEFVAAAVEPAPRLGTRVAESDEVGRCLQRLVGRSLRVEGGHVPPGDKFREVVSVLLPEARTPKQEMETP